MSILTEVYFFDNGPLEEDSREFSPTQKDGVQDCIVWTNYFRDYTMGDIMDGLLECGLPPGPIFDQVSENDLREAITEHLGGEEDNECPQLEGLPFERPEVIPKFAADAEPLTEATDCCGGAGSVFAIEVRCEEVQR